jgi:hypothetical protein
MLQERLTFADAIASPINTIMTRQRLTIAQKQLYEQMDIVTAL